MQLGIVFNHYITVADASRAGRPEGGRQRAGREPDGGGSRRNPRIGGELNQSKLGVTVSSSWADGADVSVTATYPYTAASSIVVKSGP